MSQHRLANDLELAHFPASGKMFYVPTASGHLIAYGTSVPSAVAGYAPGGLFVDTSTNKVYINNGTATSCTFTQVVDGSVDFSPVIAAGQTLSVDTIQETGTGGVTVEGVNINEYDMDVGSSGHAGSVDVFPGTASRGKIAIAAADSAGDTTTTITNASQAGARTYTIPDAGGNTNFVMAAGAQTIAGAKTFSSSLINSTNVGAAGLSGTAVEYGDGYHHTTVITGVTKSQAVVSGATTAVTGVAYTFPVGIIKVNGIRFVGTIAAPTANDTAFMGFGSAACGADNDLTGTEIDMAAKYTTGAITSGGTAVKVTGAGATAPFDGSGGAITCNLNCVDASWSQSETVVVAGTLIIDWTFLGAA